MVTLNRFGWVSGALLGALAASGCGGDSGSTTTPGPLTPGTTPPPGTGTPSATVPGTVVDPATGMVPPGTATVDPATGMVPPTTATTGPTAAPVTPTTEVPPTVTVPGSTKLCATTTGVALPLLADFETYDGITEAGLFGFPINGGTSTFMGFFGVTDDPTQTDFSFVYAAGNGVSLFAPAFTDALATAWGGAIGAWMSCLNASAFTGIQFFVRGASNAGTGNFSLTTEDLSLPDAANPLAGGTCVVEPGALECGPNLGPCSNPGAPFPITLDWTLVQIPFASMVGCSGAGQMVAATGSQVAGLNWGVGVPFIGEPAAVAAAELAMLPFEGPFIPDPMPIEVAVDDVGFY